MISHNSESREIIRRGCFNNIQNDPMQRIVFFDGEFKARYVRFSNLRAPEGLDRVGAAEFEILISSPI